MQIAQLKKVFIKALQIAQVLQKFAQNPTLVAKMIKQTI